MKEKAPPLRVGQIVIMILGGVQDAYEILDFAAAPDGMRGGMVKLMPLVSDGPKRAFWASAWVVSPATESQVRRARQQYLDGGMSEKALDGWWSSVPGVADPK